jgi:hypothetical protein
VDFATSRRKKLNWGFTASERKFDVNVGRAELGRNFHVTTECAVREAWNATSNLGYQLSN